MRSPFPTGVPSPAFIVFFLSVQVAAQSNPKAAMLEQEGARALAAGQAEAAATVYREAIALDPKNPRLRLGAGVAAVLLKRDAEAREHFEQALRARSADDTRARATGPSAASRR